MLRAVPATIRAACSTMAPYVRPDSEAPVQAILFSQTSATVRFSFSAARANAPSTAIGNEMASPGGWMPVQMASAHGLLTDW